VGTDTGVGATPMRLSWAAYSASEMARKKAPMAIEMRLTKDGSGWFGVFINARVECRRAARGGVPA
jgi:hypothetical protein